MNRRKFTGKCLMCLSGSFAVPVLNGCQSVYYTTGSLETNGLTLPTSEFKYQKNNRERVRPYIIVRNDALEFPIYLYRFSENEYSALLMKCTHQGNELQASGDHLACPAHGSEFNNRGKVAQGPAEKDLRSFEVTVKADRISINLSA